MTSASLPAGLVQVPAQAGTAAKNTVTARITDRKRKRRMAIPVAMRKGANFISPVIEKEALTAPGTGAEAQAGRIPFRFRD